MKLKVEKDGNDSLSIEHKEEIQIIFRMYMDLLIKRILNYNYDDKIIIKIINNNIR